MQIMHTHYIRILGCILLFFAPLLTAQSTLEVVRERGYLSCGVSTGLPGFSAPSTEGEWFGIDVDFCRAVAAATLGSAQKVRFIPLTAKERFEALQSGMIDILSRNSSWTLTHETQHQVSFAGVLYFDGQGFMVNPRSKIKSVQDLEGATICVSAATTSKKNLEDYFADKKWNYKPLVLETKSALIKAFNSDQCEAISSDHSQLFSLKTRLKHPVNSEVLSEQISKEPLGPVVRSDDQTWLNIVRWSLFALINAEEYGINSSNIDRLSSTSESAIRSLLMLTRHTELELGPDWVYRMLKQVGNYEEVFSRNLGADTPLNIDRGLNNLWNRGGILYAPPFR